MGNRVSHNPLNGRFTMAGLPARRPRAELDELSRRERDAWTGHSYEVAIPQEASNHWSVTEYNSNNAWNVNFTSGNINNNNKYNSLVARGVAASDELFHKFYLSIVEAYEACLHGKMQSAQAVEYMQVAWADLPCLAWELWTGTYKPSTSTCFLVKYPKLREVFAANFRDRIVHHWLCLRLEPLFEERFVSQGNVSFNCRRGFGTRKAVEHAADSMRLVSGNYRKSAWVFRGDLVGFFMSIDKGLLWYLLERFVVRWQKRYERGTAWQKHAAALYYPANGMYWNILLRVTKIIVMHHPEQDCVMNSDPLLWCGLAPRKSLFGCDDGKGEPIGNLTTQLFANFLLSFFDMYVLYLYRRHTFSYERFVDDWLNTCDDLPFLLSTLPKMEAFLRDKLKLTMHTEKRYLQPVSHGVMFVGTMIKPGRTYMSNRTLARFRERVHGFNALIMEKDELTVLDCKRIEQVVNSYLGFCKGNQTYGKRKEILDSFDRRFYKYFIIRGHYESIRAREKYREITMPFEVLGGVDVMQQQTGCHTA